MSKPKLAIGEGDLVLDVHGLYATCPTCSRPFTIDLNSIESARADVDSYNRHVHDCREKSTVRA
jgi:hypothetical protein